MLYCALLCCAVLIRAVLCMGLPVGLVGLQCWLKRQEDVLKPEVHSLSIEVPWTSGIIHPPGKVRGRGGHCATTQGETDQE